MSHLDTRLAPAAAGAAVNGSPAGLRSARQAEEGTRMRRLLDGLYGAAAWLAALAMIGVLAMVLLSIASRQFGFHVPGTDAYAGYSMAAAGFLALAHTLKRGEHIRVTLIIGRLHGRARHALEMWALSAAVLLAALFAFYSVRLAWQSHEFHDISTSNDATPLWIPQLAMAAGAVVLLIALVDEWVLELRGRRREREPAEGLRNE
jgi:TRAP-type C4-dicarboxylate transport system permease small subunit